MESPPKKILNNLPDDVQAWVRKVYQRNQSGESQDSPDSIPQLRGCKLDNLILDNVDFGVTDLTGASFVNCGLRNVSLKRVKGLEASVLRGADLSGAVLPGNINWDHEIRLTNDLTKHANRVFTASIIGCLFVLISVGSTTDVDLVLNESTFRLPFVGVDVKVGHFYIWGPALLLGLFFWLHSYLHRLYEVLGRLPARFSDGRAVDDVADPWLFTMLARIVTVRNRSVFPIMDLVGQVMVAIVGWLLTPFTMFLIWGRYLVKHDGLGSGLQVGALVLAVTGGFYFFGMTFAQIRQFRKIWQLRIALMLVLLASIGTFTWLTLGPLRGTPGSASNRLLVMTGLHPFASLYEAQLSIPPEGWTGDSSQVPFIKRAKLKGANLRHADMSNTFLYSADLRNANLQGTYLRIANLQGADLSFANLQGADLSYADLQGATLWDADLQGADLSSADLQGADLSFANLQGADLSVADLQGAHLWDANLQGATLWDADLQGADLSSADLRGTDLRGILFGHNQTVIDSSTNSTRTDSTRIQPDSLRYANLDSSFFENREWAQAAGFTDSIVAELLDYSDSSRVNSIIRIRRSVLNTLLSRGIDPTDFFGDTLLTDTSWVEEVRWYTRQRY